MHVVHTPHPSSEGAIAVCGALQELRATNIAAVRAIFLWKNKLGDRGAAAVAALVQQSAIPGFERLWVAEVHLSHNNITVHGAQELFAAAHRYPRNANTGLVPLWLRLEHNGIGEYLCVCVHCFWCVCVCMQSSRCGVVFCGALRERLNPCAFMLASRTRAFSFIIPCTNQLSYVQTCRRCRCRPTAKQRAVAIEIEECSGQ